MSSDQRVPQAVSLGSLGNPTTRARNGRPGSMCGRCGGATSARTKDSGVRYCHDCVKVDPVFCGRV